MACGGEPALTTGIPITIISGTTSGELTTEAPTTANVNGPTTDRTTTDIISSDITSTGMISTDISTDVTTEGAGELSSAMSTGNMDVTTPQYDSALYTVPTTVNQAEEASTVGTIDTTMVNSGLNGNHIYI